MKQIIKEYIPSLITILLFTWFINYVIGIAHITSGSMEPTLYTHDFMIYNRLAYIFEEPQRGDIISFNKDGEIYCKRVIGIEGDTVSFENMYVHINGQKIEEDYVKMDVTWSENTFTVPEDCVFVLGDNRIFSGDSRIWDEPYVPIENINGKSIWIIPVHKIIEWMN